MTNLIDARTLTPEQRRERMPDSVKCWEFLRHFVEHRDGEGRRVFGDIAMTIREKGYEFRTVFREATK